MKKSLWISLFAFISLTLAACGAPTPEDLCAKADKKEECTKSMKEMKEAFGDDLWKEFAKCAKDKDLNKDDGKEIVTCFNGDMIAKMAEKAKKEMEADGKKMQEDMKKMEEDAKKMQEEAMKNMPTMPPPATTPAPPPDAPPATTPATNP